MEFVVTLADVDNFARRRVTRGRTFIGPRSVVRALEVCLSLALACSCSAAFDSDRTIAQFAHTAWGPKEGAPRPVTALAQSVDGYLWLGSPGGLYRFDGVVFEHYRPQSGGPFPYGTVDSLLALPNGDLWIAFSCGAISVLRNGNATNYSASEGVPDGWVWNLAQDREGTIWAATESGLARLEGSRWKKVGKDWNFTGKFAFAIFLDRHGTLWVSTENTLVFLPSGARRFQPTGIRVGQVPRIAQAPNGKLWMPEATRSVRPIPLSDKREPPDETEVQVGSQGILFDHEGALWITTLGDGLRRAPAPELLKGRIKEFSTTVESFTAKDGLTDDFVFVILQDREENVWVGTNNGLDRFRKTNLVPVVLPVKPTYIALAAGDAGDVWVERLNVMIRVHGGRADRGHPFPGQADSAYRDPAGVIWWLCLDAIYRYNAGNYTRIALPTSFPKPYYGPSPQATEDGSGALWLSAEREGLFYLKKGVWHQLEPASEFVKLSPTTAFTDWLGRAWFGYFGGTIILLEHEKIQKVFPANESPVGTVQTVNGRGRHTWVGGEFGLAFFDGNRFRRIVPADAETFGSVFGVEETLSGSLWLAESRGAIEIPATEIQRVLGDPSHRVKNRIFDSFDGLPGIYPRVIQASDGKLWFSASDGIVWVDPAKISTNALPPPVLIRSVRANGRPAGSLTNLVLPPRTTNLQISYTALSLSVPEKVRFRYKLEEVDSDWQDAGTRREAFYNRLGPGKYHFRVIARNNDGVWNEVGAAWKFSIAPTFYQTVWFRTLLALACIGVMWPLYRLRIRRITVRADLRYAERLEERTRIARELHDTLLQSFQGLMLRFQVVNEMLPSGEARNELEQTLQRADQAIAEGRDAVRDLRSSTAISNDLADVVNALGDELATGDSASFRLVVEGPARNLHPIVRDELYGITREALRNAFSHAQAQHIEVEITYAERLFRLRIRDDGDGIPPGLLEEGRSGHYGLPGMRERAKKIDAKLDIWSGMGTGTEIDLSIAGSVAYRASPARRRFHFF
jgi:signal transduction histidine kinase/ligand-binding sensor domain-containing protein